MSDHHILELFTFFDGLFMVGYIKIKSNTITWSYFKGKVCECCRNTTIRIVVVNFHTCLLVFSCFQYTISFKSISDSVSWDCRILISTFRNDTDSSNSWSTIKCYRYTWEAFAFFPYLVVDRIDKVSYFKFEDTVWRIVTKVSIDSADFKVILTR